MASYAGLLDLRGPCGHTVRDLPAGEPWQHLSPFGWQKGCPNSVSHMTQLSQEPPSCFAAGVLPAAATSIPPAALQLFVKMVLDTCSRLAGSGPIVVYHVLRATTSLQCPGVEQAHLDRFDRQVWPRQRTVAELERYYGIFSRKNLNGMEPSEREQHAVCD